MKITIDRNIDSKLYTILSWYIANLRIQCFDGYGKVIVSNIYQLDKDKEGQVIFGLTAHEHAQVNNISTVVTCWTDETYRYLIFYSPNLVNMNYNVSRVNYENEALRNGLEIPSLHEKRSIGELWFDKFAKQAHIEFNERFNY